MKNNEITICLNDENLKRVEALADTMGITIEELTEKALGSFLYTVNDYLQNINEQVFPQIMFD